MRELLQKNSGMKIELIEENGWRGFLIGESGKSAQLMAFTESLMLQISATLGDLDLVKKCWDAMDTAGLAKAN